MIRSRWSRLGKAARWETRRHTRPGSCGSALLGSRLGSACQSCWRYNLQLPERVGAALGPRPGQAGGHQAITRIPALDCAKCGSEHPPAVLLLVRCLYCSLPPPRVRWYLQGGVHHRFL